MIKAKIAGMPISYKCFVFSGGEIQVKLEDDGYVDGCIDYTNRVWITAHIANSNDFMELSLLTDALRRKYKGISLSLIMPYIPYARQDRAMTLGESLSIKVFAGFLNGLNFDSVEVWDAHSDVSLALIDRVIHRPVERILTKEILCDSILVSPDAGSLKKVSKVAQVFGNRMVRADKNRSVIDGSITGTVVYSEHVGDSNFLMVDDICDGGRTFIELGKELRKLTNGQINLYVTHGIFSKGLTPLLGEWKDESGVIDNIYCAVPFP